MALRELLATFKIDVDTKPLEQAEKGLSNLGSSLKTLGGVMAAGVAGKALASLTVDAIAMAGQVSDLSSKIGMNSDELQRWQYIASQSGASAEAANAGLKNLSKQLALTTQVNATAAASFEALGVSITDDTGASRSLEAVMPEVAQAISQITDENEQAAVAAKLFGAASTDLLPTLRQGAEGVATLSAAYTSLGLGMDKAFLATAGEAGAVLTDLKAQFQALKVAIAQQILPWFIKIGNVVRTVAGKFLAFNKQMNLMRHVLNAIAMLVSAKMVMGFVKIVPGVMKAARAFAALKVQVFAANIPLLAIIAAIGLVYIAIDDIAALMRGDKSLIGEYFEKMNGAGSAAELAQTLRNAWDAVKDAFVQAKPALDKLWDSFKLWMAEDGINGMTAGVVELTKAIAAMGLGLIATAGATAKFLQGDFAGAVDVIKKTGDAVFGKTTSVYDQATGTVSTQSIGGLYGASLPKPPAAQAQAVNMQNEVRTTINVQGTSNPEQVAKEVAQKQGRTIADANQDALSAVQRFAAGN